MEIDEWYKMQLEIDVLDDIEIPCSISEHSDDMTNEGNLVRDDWRLTGVMVDAQKLSDSKGSD
jgi:hypothetical protein